ncbi:hypothetical protein VNO80_17093 [Phaseolus coccineus]|uniref:Uncharacterized protein n=1 Tax=Phaseolus coccineus TaxID=3886 RepID=A0AAN9R3B8_PHACN
MSETTFFSLSYRRKKEQRGATHGERNHCQDRRHRQTQERDRGKDRLASSVSPKTNKRALFLRFSEDLSS